MSLDFRVGVVAWFGVAFLPGLDVRQVDVWTEFAGAGGGYVSSHTEFSRRTTKVRRLYHQPGHMNNCT